jgi:hypothetical protein
MPKSLGGLLHVPDGVMIGPAITGKVTFIRLNEEVILIKIGEYPEGS